MSADVDGVSDAAALLEALGGMACAQMRLVGRYGDVVRLVGRLEALDRGGGRGLTVRQQGRIRAVSGRPRGDVATVEVLLDVVAA